MKFLLQNKNKKKNILSIYSNLSLILIVVIIFPYSLNSTLEEVHEAIKEVAYSFYMRGKNIQYSDIRNSAFHPEDATQQSTQFLVCWTLAQAVYTELLNITVPCGDFRNFQYSVNHLGSPEVIAYTKKNLSENAWYFYTPGTKDNITKVINPTLHKNIIPILQIGDIISYTGHTFIIYDIERDSDGNATDAIIMETSASDYIESKLCKRRELPGGVWGDTINFLFYDMHSNKNFKTGIEQGTLTIGKISHISVMWDIYYLPEYRMNEYCILRFIQRDSKGNAILKYKNFYENDKSKPNDFKFNDLIELPKRNLDRIKFHHIYIEKTLNKCNGGFVDIGEILIYKIVIKNNGEKDYVYDVIVIENLSKYVTYEAHYETKKNLEFSYDIKKKKIIWNIGKLKSGEEVVVYYYVKVTSGKYGDIVENLGFVGNIRSSKVVNTIGRNLNNKKKELIEKKFQELKKEKKYNGKKLINEIYKQSFNTDMKFDEFDIKNLVINQRALVPQQPIAVNKNHTFYGAILNNYWNALWILKSALIEGGEEVDLFRFLGFLGQNKFIYSGNFRTGDILIYLNNIDKTYDLDENQKLIKHDVTYESGEYSYIYIEGKGFMGINKGNDPNNIKDERNEFNSKYYKDNKLSLFYQTTPSNLSDEFLEMANFQTLFVKDYFVILRPSVIFDFKYKNYNWIIILDFTILIIIILIIAITLILLKKRRNNPKNNKNENLLTKGLNQ